MKRKYRIWFNDRPALVFYETLDFANEEEGWDYISDKYQKYTDSIVNFEEIGLMRVYSVRLETGYDIQVGESAEEVRERYRENVTRITDVTNEININPDLLHDNLIHLGYSDEEAQIVRQIMKEVLQ